MMMMMMKMMMLLMMICCAHIFRIASSPAIFASMIPPAAKLRKRYTADVGFETPPVWSV